MMLNPKNLGVGASLRCLASCARSMALVALAGFVSLSLPVSLLLSLALAMTVGATPALAESHAEESFEEPYVMDSVVARKAVDAVIVRPALATRLGLGALFFAVTSPLLAVEVPISGWESSNLAESYEFFVLEPSESLRRPLGEFF